MRKTVSVHTNVTPGGQYPDRMIVRSDGIPDDGQSAESVFSDDFSPENLSVDDFSFRGKANGWMDPSEHEFSASFSDVKMKDGQLILTFKAFPEKYFYVTEWKVENSRMPELTFTSTDVTEVITPVADQFETFSKEDGAAFTYHLFTPESADQPLPVVVVFHGYADTHNLLTYRTSIAWAEASAQAKRPCYVLSPVIEDALYISGEERAKVFEGVYNRLQAMISEGKADKNRIYICGNSFGGMSTVEFCEKYPQLPAAAMPMCSALNYSDTAMEHLDQMAGIPVYIAQAENDATISSENSKQMYSKLKAAGTRDIHLKIYSDEEMNAAGGTSDTSSNYSYHHVELAVMEDERYAEWMFSHVKGDVR